MATTTQTSKATTAPTSTGGTVVPPSKSPSVTTVEGGSGKGKWLWLLLVLIVGAAAAGATYYYMHQQEQKKTDQVSAQIAQLQSQLAQAKKKAGSDVPPNSSVVKISALGIQFTVPNTIKDIVVGDLTPGTLSTGVTYQGVNLSTQKLTLLDSGCSVTGTPALGGLSKVNGQYPSSQSAENTPGSLVKQFDTYYIAFSHPQSVCGDAASTQSEATADLNLFVAALPTIQLSQ